LFEAAIQAGQKIIRIDVLKKTGRKLHLIEVKAKSHHSEADEDKQKKKLEKYIEDVAFQYMVLSEAYPEFQIECSLLTPDKAKRTQIDGLAGWFSIQAGSDSTKELQEIITQSKPRFIKPEVVFKYENDPQRAQYLSALIEDGILGYLPVTNEVKQIQSVIQNRANLFLDILNEVIQSTHYKIGKNCKGCEFNSGSNLPNGYKECWGDLAFEKDHIFDLYFGNPAPLKNFLKAISIFCIDCCKDVCMDGL
jgi:hypothetical protein